MRNLTLLICIVCSIQAISQINLPFPDLTGAWVMSSISDNGPGSPLNINRYRDYIWGDTVIQSNQYSQLWYGWNTDIYDTTMVEQQPSGYLRTDVLKVYFRGRNQLNPSINGFPVDTGDVLLYDFGIQPGDTFTLAPFISDPQMILLDSVDSVMFNGNYYRRFNFTSISYVTWGDPYYWIEGIGSSEGLFPFYLHFETEIIFHCFHENDESFEFNLAGFASCFDIPLGINKLPEITVNLYPIPASEYITIENNFVGRVNLQIHDLFGKILLNKEINKSKYELDLSGFPHGTYIVSLYGKDEVIHRKLVKK